MFKSGVSILLLEMAKKSRAWPARKCAILKHELGDTNYLYLSNIKSVPPKVLLISGDEFY